MCGIAGFIDRNIQSNRVNILQAMGDVIQHRGPDASGTWYCDKLGINLIHRRLSILDLSVAGSQPMLSHSGRYVMVFNGEVYNYEKLRVELEQECVQINWRGHSDTEVILSGFDHWGIKETVAKCAGMFAVAVWDQQDQALYLMRDRIGEKPLYYGYSNGVFSFASELKALRQHPKLALKIDRDAVAQFIMHSCIPGSLSIYKGIYKLKPGHILKLSYAEFGQQILPSPVPYWLLMNHVEQTYAGDHKSAIIDLETILDEVISEQMLADVPVGCFLSGGIDSSLIAALMQKHSTNQISTFSIGFNDPKYNEAEYARAVAKHLGTDHHELYLSDRDALDVVPKLATIYDEPFADSSQIPTYLLCKMARQKVTVALSGDGGDEIFGGYQRHLKTNLLLDKIRRIPSPVVSTLKPFLAMINPIVKSGNLSRVNFLLNQQFEEYYLSFMSSWLDGALLNQDQSNLKSQWSYAKCSDDLIQHMQYSDTMGYLPDDIMVKVDRASMATSLETRAPFLHHKVVEFGFSLPRKFKLNGGTGKVILRDVLYKHVPRNLIERPKSGFAIPLDKWIRGELKDWAVSLLDEKTLTAQGYFDPKIVNNQLNAHLAGTRNIGSSLWPILMFQQWLESEGKTCVG